MTSNGPSRHPTLDAIVGGVIGMVILILLLWGGIELSLFLGGKG